MPEPKYLGVQFWVDKAAVAKTAAPSGASYVNVGRVSRMSLSPQVDSREVLAPDPGQINRIDVIPVSNVLNFSATVVEISALAWRLAFGSALALDATAAAQYNPGAGLGLLRAWTKFQWYTEANVLANTVDLYAALKIESDLNFDNNAIECQINGMVIKSAHNSGVFAGLVA